MSELFHLSSDQLFAGVFYNSPMAIAIAALADTRILEINDAFLRQTGFDRAEIVGRTLAELGVRASDNTDLIGQDGLQGPEAAAEREATMITKGGELRRAVAFVETVATAEQPILFIRFYDSTERKRTEDALRESEERFQLAGRATADAMYEWDVRSGNTRWNHGQQTLFGYAGEEVRRHMWWREQVHPEDRERTVASVVAALADRDQFWSCEYRYRRADGSYAHVVDRGYFIYDETGEAQRMVGAMIDITDRVQLAEAQARATMEERQRLARDLHDSVTQSLYSLTLMAEAARRRVDSGDVAPVGDLVKRLGETALQSLKEMRLLVYELRPAILEREGLVGALQRRLDAVERRAGVDARLLVHGRIELPEPLEEGLFFIAQEALNNALKHAAATTVTVTLRAASGYCELEVADNGKGFDPQALGDGSGLGLVSMCQRADRLDGLLTIQSQPGEGARIHTIAPI